ncbi:hypothetical protein WUBG_10167, partial [Wuchereria bancrofti]
IFILISDGNGHELWHVAQRAGKNLQNANIEIFAVPISRDHNLNELTLYTGDVNRVYIETEQRQFVRTISSLINQCVGANLSVANVAKKRLSVFDGDTMINVNLNPQHELTKQEVTQSDKITLPVGNLDLLFAIDLSPASPDDLKNQLKLATELVNKIADEDINRKANSNSYFNFRSNLEWGRATTKAQVLQHFEFIKYTMNNSSLVNGITLVTQYAEKFRRPNAQLIIILFSNGSNQDSWHSIIQTAKKLHELHETIIYAITTSKQYRFVELEAFTRDKWKIYVDGRIGQFVTDASKQLVIGKVNENDELIDIRSLPIIEFIQTHNDPVDLIILVDTSIVADDDFENSKRFLRELLRSLQMIDSQSQIRISLITFTDKAHVEVELNKSTTNENVLVVVEKTSK